VVWLGDSLHLSAQPHARCCALQVIHWLRLGCVPVGVLEGRPPPEKLEALRARFRAHTGSERGSGGVGGAGAAFQWLGGRVGAMLRAMVRAVGLSRRNIWTPGLFNAMKCCRCSTM